MADSKEKSIQVIEIDGKTRIVVDGKRYPQWECKCNKCGAESTSNSNCTGCSCPKSGWSGCDGTMTCKKVSD